MKVIMLDQKSLSDAISSILSSREPRLFDDRGSTSYRQAGVLLPLLEGEGICKVLFTKMRNFMEIIGDKLCLPPAQK